VSGKTHFLRPLLESGAGHVAHVLRNQRTGQTVAGTIELAQDSKTRTRGLLGRSSLAEGSVMIIAPCNAIHTLFMRFTIDVIFADRQGRVVRVCRRLRPWRIGVAFGAFAALELAEGSIDRGDVRKGDKLTVS
jgi:uncharacterized membrane protein (UPF0127 family)